MRHGNLYRGRNIDDGLMLLIRLPHIKHTVADLHRIIHLCAREALRAVLKGKAPLRLPGDLLKQLRPVHGQFLYFLL